VWVDAALFEQVLVNLLDNAARYTPPGSRVRIAARRDDGGVAVEVADDGPGLGPGEERRVFEKFYRKAGARGGFGLGLSICRAAVEAHGGTIRAENRTPRGAAFRFTIPAAAPPPAVPEATHDERAS
jgi:two-component system sensor histidine kinase KdpD